MALFLKTIRVNEKYKIIFIIQMIMVVLFIKGEVFDIWKQKNINESIRYDSDMYYVSNCINESQHANTLMKKCKRIQEAMLISKLSVLDNVLLPLYIGGKVDDKAYAKAFELLERLGIGSLKNVIVQKLSGGEKQRVEMARALISNPDIIIADEPTASLDENNAKIILNELRRINTENNSMVVVATHDNRILSPKDNILLLKNNVKAY